MKFQTIIPIGDGRLICITPEGIMFTGTVGPDGLLELIQMEVSVL